MPREPVSTASTSLRSRQRRPSVLVTAAALLLAGVGAWLRVDNGSRQQPASVGKAVSASTSAPAPAVSSHPAQRIAETATSPSGDTSTQNTTSRPNGLPVPAGLSTAGPAATAAPQRTDSGGPAAAASRRPKRPRAFPVALAPRELPDPARPRPHRLPLNSPRPSPAITRCCRATPIRTGPT